MFRHDGAEPCRPGDAALGIDDGKGQRLLRFRQGQRVGDEFIDIFACFERLREPAGQIVADRQFGQRRRMIRPQRLQPNEAVRQRDRCDPFPETRRDQLPPRSEMVPSRRRSAFSLMKPSASFWL
jgi:hypothetical protein